MNPVLNAALLTLLVLVPPFLAPPAHAQAEMEVRAPFVTTPAEVVERMLALAATRPTDYVVDLCSGDGLIVIAAAEKFGARGLGLELDPKLVDLSRERARAAGVADRVEFRVQDVLRADFTLATVVTVYLLPSLMARLAPIFLDDLKPGSRVVTHAFMLPSWKPDRVEKVKIAGPHPMQGDESTVFMWVVPAKARGAWRAVTPEGEWKIRVAQNFQEIEVEGEGAGAKLAVADARLEGTRIQFFGGHGEQGARFWFRGRVEGNRIAGDVELYSGAAKRVVPLVFVK